MLRSKLLCTLIISGALVFVSCSDSGTDSDDPDDPGNGSDPVEPTASIDNPNDGANLEGEVTLIVDGEAENGFDELRISVGDEEVESVSNPSLPYELTLATYEYNNGDYDLSAELDPSGEDTTVEASVSASFENYMVTLETDGYIADLKDSYDAAYLFQIRMEMCFVKWSLLQKQTVQTVPFIFCHQKLLKGKPRRIIHLL